jgi:Domain of unknown function (DUF6268)
MRFNYGLSAFTLAAAWYLCTGSFLRAADFVSEVDNDWFRAWPPAGVTYSFPSTIYQGNTRLGDIDTLEFHATYIQSVKVNNDFKWLVGADWYRQQASVPSGAPIPNTLQSAAAVLGFDWRFRERWRARLEVQPGIYSDFRDISSDDINAPFSIEASYSINPNLLIGGQLSVNARRDSPLLGGAGVRWKFADDWLLSLWFPRPRIEFNATDNVTLFAGAAFTGGTYVVADDFGSRRGRSNLDGQAVDYQEVRVGGGLRYTFKDKLGIELGGGWTVDRRYHFHERNLLLNGDGAPYVQLSLGLMF